MRFCGLFKDKVFLHKVFSVNKADHELLNFNDAIIMARSGVAALHRLA